MNWAYLRPFPWLDTRARFVAGAPRGGALLDLGTSDGETLGHIAELRPDLKLFAADIAGKPERYPTGCQFHKADLEHDKLPWGDGTVDAITCMHLVEHLNDLTMIFRETARLLKPGGRLLYATCSVFKCEGQDQADAFLQRHRADGARLDPGSPGHLLPLPENLAGAGEASDGFFYALFVKT